MLLGQRLAHMAPNPRRRIRDPPGELLVGALDFLPKVKAGNVCAPAALARVGDVSEDRGEVEQRVSPAPDRFGRRSPRKPSAPSALGCSEGPGGKAQSKQ